MRKAEIVSVGGIAVDVIVQSPQLPAPGQCVVASALHHGLGGKAANQVVAAVRLGGVAALVGSVGGDAGGEMALTRLAAEGVAIEYVHRDAGAATAMVVLQVDAEGRKQAAVLPGANGRVSRDVVDAASEVIASARIVMVQLEIPMEVVRRAIEIARGGGAQVILDASPARPLPPELLREASVVKANAAEGRALTGIEVTGVESARAAARRLLELGVQLVAIEAGDDGNLFLSAEEEVFLPLYDVAPVDRTGAGDAMVGAMAVAMVERWPLARATAFATAAAALTTRSLGAQPGMPRRDEVERLVGVRLNQRN
jgi:ribokinase